MSTSRRRYWLTDTKNGGAFGFATEISPGAAVPPIESLRAMLTPAHLWPIDRVWNFHAGGGEFKTIDKFTDRPRRRAMARPKMPRTTRARRRR